MFSLDDRPVLPETPSFRADMEEFLVSVARRAPRRSRSTRPALLGVAAGVAAVAIALGAAVVANGTSGVPGGVAAGGVHVHLADFSVDTNSNGTVTLALSEAQILDPGALRQALAQAGIPARVTVGSFCYNPVVPNRDALSQAFTMERPGPDEAAVVVINPSKLPVGSTLAVGYVMNGAVGKPHFELLTAGAPVTCSTNPPPPPAKPIPAPGDSLKAAH
jgi:hypothetical protein